MLVAQLGAMEFRNQLLKGDETVLKSLRLGTQSTVGEVLKNLGRAPPLAVLQLCYDRQAFDFAGYLLQHADDMDFVQDTLTAIGESRKLNPIFNGVLAGFNRRRRHQRFKFGHHTLQLDRLRFADSASSLDSDLYATELTKNIKKEGQDTRGRSSRPSPCYFFQRIAGCRRNPCPFTHKCSICGVPGHGAIDCRSRRHRDDRGTGSSRPREERPDKPPDPLTRRPRAQ